MGTWTPRWECIGGNSLSGPAVASWGTGRLDVFWRGADGMASKRSFILDEFTGTLVAHYKPELRPVLHHVQVTV
jgi:hypothetical protein